ncbi:MAG: DUF2975 domain-containing protein [Ruminococcaceae bacterium]|nr:DUF2975 domain-containing protein [Oscillospiraceae bacterium]
MKGADKIAKVVTKVVEVFHWIAAALMAAATVCSIVYPAGLKYFVDFDAKECCGVELGIYGFEVNAPLTDGAVNMTAFCLFGIGAVLILSLMAMIFRNLNAIIKNSEGTTPFQPQNVKKLREVGFFSIATPAVGFVMSIIAYFVLGSEMAEVSNSLDGLVIGIVVLCITQFFAHGIELEKDVDGLL